jgi:crossover junction endodeoxyribonuclease RuvC
MAWFEIAGQHLGGTPHGFVIEFVHSMPGQGVTSMFRFGRSAGSVESLALMTGLPVHLVAPRMWKTYFALLGQPKEAATAEASRLLGRDGTRGVKAKIGLADAALIAIYGADHLIT